LTENEPVDSEKTLPPSPNPDQLQQMVTTAMSGNPDVAVDALVAGGIMTKEQAEMMRSESRAEQEKFAQFAAQIAQNTEGVRLMAHAMDNWRDGVRADILRQERSLELIRRTLSKLKGFSEAYDKLEADTIEREETAKKSSTSKTVTTSPKPGKVA